MFSIRDFFQKKCKPLSNPKLLNSTVRSAVNSNFHLLTLMYFYIHMTFFYYFL